MSRLYGFTDFTNISILDGSQCIYVPHSMSHTDLAHTIMRVVVLDPCSHTCLHVVVATVLRILVACLD